MNSINGSSADKINFKKVRKSKGCFPAKSVQIQYALETQPNSLFYLFVRVYADLCTVKTMNFWYNEAIRQ